MNTRVSRRYSKALFDASTKAGIIDKMDIDVNLIYLSLLEVRKLNLLFKSPVVNKKIKLNILAEIFGSKIEKLTFNFIKLLMDHNREIILSDILEDFIKYSKYQKGIVDVKVKTVVDIDDNIKNNIIKNIENKFNKKISAKFEIDKNIIGGFTAQIDDSVIDASIFRQLENLRNRLKKAIILK
jgi:F-type H+-transporting ATPase subunit delta